MRANNQQSMQAKVQLNRDYSFSFARNYFNFREKVATFHDFGTH